MTSATSDTHVSDQALSFGDRRAITAMIRDKVKESQAIHEWNSKQWSYGDLGTTLNSFSDALLIAIRDLLLTQPKGFFQREKRDDFLFLLARKSDKVDATTIHEYVVFGAAANNNSLSTTVDLLRGLRCYPQLPVFENYVYADEGTKAQVITLVNVAGNLHTHATMQQVFSFVSAKTSGPAPQKISGNTLVPVTVDVEDCVMLTDDNLVDFLLERPDAAGEVVDLVIGKGVNDGVLIRDILEADVKPLREGIL